MSKANVFPSILIYALTSTLIIDKDVLYHVYILSVLYENNHKIICHTKSMIELWKTLVLKFILIYTLKSYSDKKSLFYQIY